MLLFSEARERESQDHLLSPDHHPLKFMFGLPVCHAVRDSFLSEAANTHTRWFRFNISESESDSLGRKALARRLAQIPSRLSCLLWSSVKLPTVTVSKK